MSRQQLNVLVPLLYALVIMVAVFAFEDAVGAVAAIGGILVAIYFAVFRRSVPLADEGRERNRDRNRDR